MESHRAKIATESAIGCYIRKRNRPGNSINVARWPVSAPGTIARYRGRPWRCCEVACKGIAIGIKDQGLPGISLLILARVLTERINRANITGGRRRIGTSVTDLGRNAYKDGTCHMACFIIHSFSEEQN